MKLLSCLWRSVGEVLSSKFVPSLTHGLYKGQMGRIAIIGGSPDYTGAPYYAGEAALRFGADLSSIYCAHEAAIPIKSYSPELMVTPFYAYNGTNLERQNISFQMDPMLGAVQRMHSYVVGPGLGRDPAVGQQMVVILRALIDARKQITIDADGLWLLTMTKDPSGCGDGMYFYLDVIRGAHNVILTPNRNEFNLLAKAVAARLLQSAEDGGWSLDPVSFAPYLLDTGSVGMSVGAEKSLNQQISDILLDKTELGDDLSHLGMRVLLMSKLLGGVTVLLKGHRDIIGSAGSGSGPDYAYAVSIDEHISSGGPAPSRKRCGGQGDILSGCTAVAAYWGSLLHAGNSQSNDGGSTAHVGAVDKVYCDFFSTLLAAQPSVDLESVQFSNSSSSIAVLNGESESGTQAPSVSAALQRHLSVVQKGNIMACVLSSMVTKIASGLAFEKFRRGTTAVNVLDEVGSAFYLLTGAV